MNEPRSEEALRDSLVRKLDPARFTQMSNQMAAIVGYILDEPFTTPRIVELMVTALGGVLAVNEDQPGRSIFIGGRTDLDRNLVSLLTSTPDLTPDEIALFGRLQRRRIKRW